MNYMKKIKKIMKTFWWRVKSFWAVYYYDNPSKKLKIIGITGTNGKTTTTTLLYKVVRSLGFKAGIIGTVEILINDEKIILKGKVPSTTPDSVSLTKVLAKMVKAGCEYVFMEVSSHALDQGRVKWVHFAGGIFTNLTHDHLDYHSSFENYFLAKKKFFNMLPAKAFSLSNFDDGRGAMMLEGTKARPYFYGFVDRENLLGGISSAKQNNFFAGQINKLDFSGLELVLDGDDVKAKLLGKFNAYNLLAVWSTIKLLDFDIEKVKKILEDIEPPAGRFEYFISDTGIVVIVDYAHTPDALVNVLTTAQEFNTSGGRIISVFGCGGDRDISKRKVMGKLGVTHSDLTIFTSDNPRREPPDKIIAEMQIDLSKEDLNKVKVVVERREAILESVKLAKKGDIILCAGKGHETYQEIKGVKYPFNDMEEYKKIFNKVGSAQEFTV